MIYDLLQEKVKTAKQKYYMVKVNEFTINLASMDEVQQLLEAALTANAVSYTHLDVYKRQLCVCNDGWYFCNRLDQ